MRKLQVLLAMVLVGIVAAVTLAQHPAPEVTVSRIGRAAVDMPEPYEYRVALVDQAMADKALNNFASDGWSVMQVDWDDELNRAAIVFRRMAPLNERER